MDRGCRDKGLHCSQPSLRPCPCRSHREISAFICHERRPSCSAQEIKTAPCRKGSASAGLFGVPVSYGLGWIPLLGSLGFVGLGKAPSAASGTGQGQGMEGMPGRRDRDSHGQGMNPPAPEERQPLAGERKSQRAAHPCLTPFQMFYNLPHKGFPL